MLVYKAKDVILPMIFLSAASTACGIAIGHQVRPIHEINPDLLRATTHLCRNNTGPRMIYQLRENVYDVRCTDGALFDNQLIEMSDKQKVGGAEVQK